MIGRALCSLNRLPIWRRQLSTWGNTLTVATFDRFLYLILHRLAWMGRHDRVFLEQRIRPGMRVVDIGANIGLYTLLLSRLVGKCGTVTAIEPDPCNFELLKTNCAFNSVTNVVLHHAAAGASHGSMRLYRSLVHSGDSRMVFQQPSRLRQSVEVEVRTIDELVDCPDLDLDRLPEPGRLLEDHPTIPGMHQRTVESHRTMGCSGGRVMEHNVGNRIECHYAQANRRSLRRVYRQQASRFLQP